MSTAMLLTLLLVSPAAPQTRQWFPSNAEIRRLVDERLALGGGVGVVVGLLDAHGSRRVVSAGSSGNGVRLDENTVFEIGSVTKTFTAILLAEMVGRGELRLEDPVARYLPPGQRVPDHAGRPITLLDLATHYGGLPREASNLRPSEPRNPYADYRVSDMYAFLSAYELPRAPGESWAYSNIGMALLGHALERRAGAPYERLLRARVLDRLGMRDSGITLSERLASRAARGFDDLREPTPMLDRGALPGAGGLRSTVHDLLSYAAANLHPAEDRLGRAIRAAQQPRRPRQENQQIGLAWTVERPAQRTITWHWGASGGYRSYLGLDLEARRAVVILANATPLFNDLGHHLLDPEIPLAPPEAAAFFVKLVHDEGLPAALARMQRMKGAPEWHFDSDAFHACGQSLLRARRTADAIAVFTMNTGLFPADGAPWAGLAAARLAAGDRDAAVAAFRRALELDPGNADGIAALERIEAVH